MSDFKKMDQIFIKSPHNPPHLFLSDSIYMLTASTYHKKNLIQPDGRKGQWKNAFFNAAKLYDWQVVAWVVLDNHYHAMVKSPDSPLTMSKFINSCHKFTARQWNQEDQTPDRKIWYNFWDTCIRSDMDYMARLKYIFWNPVKHGMALNPEDYQYSNYFEYTDFFSGDIEEVNDVPEA